MNDFVIIKNRRADPFQWNLDRYAQLVEEIEGGYGMCIYEYTNDLYCRNVIIRQCVSPYLQQNQNDTSVDNAAKLIPLG